MVLRFSRFARPLARVMAVASEETLAPGRGARAAAGNQPRRRRGAGQQSRGAARGDRLRGRGRGRRRLR